VVISSILPKITLAAICALIAHQLGVLTWSLYPVQETNTYKWTPVTGGVSTETFSLSTEAIQAQNVFGQFMGEKKTQQQSIDAPKTRLKLALVGIVAASDPAFSSVIIEYKNAQDSYFIDSDIPGTGAVVSEIYFDRIIITVDGEQQTLILDGLEEDNNTLAKTERGEQSRSSKSKRTSKTKALPLDRDELLDNPGKLLDYISISPVREGESVKGYRVNPGKNPDIFEEAGLQPDDLVIELNGVDLTDTSKAVGLMKEFPTMTEMSLTVDRDGELNELYFSIP
jgi:general secretion pathway protein C